MFTSLPFPALFAALFLLTDVCVAQNLLNNGNFDTDLSGWTFPDAQPIRSGFDADGASNYIARASSPDCSGGAFIVGGLFLPSVGQWQRYTSGTLLQISAPLTPATVEVLLGIDKTPAGGSFSGYFDAVSLVYDPIFNDGFQ